MSCLSHEDRREAVPARTDRPRRRARLPLALLSVGVLGGLPLGCRTQGKQTIERATAAVQLVGPIWTCVQLEGTKVEQAPQPTVLFGADGRVSGTTGVNRFFGTFERRGKTGLSFQEFGVTRRSSTPERMELERAFMAGLENATAFRITGLGIELLADAKVVMQLSGVTDPEQWIPTPPPLEGPPGSMEGEVEWIKLTSGEWLKGELKVLSRESVEFESDELDTLSIDWDKVAELYTTRQFTLLLEDRQTRIGALRVVGDRIVVMSAGGQEVLSRADVQRMVPGEPREANYWSGSVDISATARTGNTEQTDVTTYLSALRRTAQTRLDLNVQAIYGSQNKTKVTNNQRFAGNFDSYISSRLYWTILGLEVYADEFQNINRRIAPFTAIGYTTFDTATLESNVSLGIGWRTTLFDSVEAGEDREVKTGFGQVSFDIDADLTEKVEFTMTYSAQIGLEDTNDTNQNLMAELDFDFMEDFDVFIRATWTRVGKPAADEDGNFPEKDDYRYDFGWRWSW